MKLGVVLVSVFLCTLKASAAPKWTKTKEKHGFVLRYKSCTVGVNLEGNPGNVQITEQFATVVANRLEDHSTCGFNKEDAAIAGLVGLTDLNVTIYRNPQGLLLFIFWKVPGWDMPGSEAEGILRSLEIGEPNCFAINKGFGSVSDEVNNKHSFSNTYCAKPGSTGSWQNGKILLTPNWQDIVGYFDSNGESPSRK